MSNRIRYNSSSGTYGCTEGGAGVAAVARAREDLSPAATAANPNRPPRLDDGRVDNSAPRQYAIANFQEPVCLLVLEKKKTAAMCARTHTEGSTARRGGADGGRRKQTKCLKEGGRVRGQQIFQLPCLQTPAFTVLGDDGRRQTCVGVGCGVRGAAVWSARGEERERRDAVCRRKRWRKRGEQPWR